MDIKFTEKGPFIISALEVSGVEYKEPDRETIFPTFKDTLIYALTKRANHCIKDLQDNSSRVVAYNNYSVTYAREDGIVVDFNNPSYQAMLEAIELIKKDEYDKLTAHQLDQLVKALYYVKPISKGGFSFNQLVSYTLENCILKMQELVIK